MRVSMRHVPPSNDMGRFGGGWQWKLGFQANSGFRTIIFNLLVFSIRVER